MVAWDTVTLVVLGLVKVNVWLLFDPIATFPKFRVVGVAEIVPRVGGAEFFAVVKPEQPEMQAATNNPTMSRTDDSARSFAATRDLSPRPDGMAVLSGTKRKFIAYTEFYGLCRAVNYWPKEQTKNRGLGPRSGRRAKTRPTRRAITMKIAKLPHWCRLERPTQIDTLTRA